MESGFYGGDVQIVSCLVEKQVDMVIFFCDLFGKYLYEVDVNMLMCLCDVYNILLVINVVVVILFMKNIQC